MQFAIKLLAILSIAAILSGCVASGSSGRNVGLLERVTGDDIDGDCRIQGPTDDDGPC